MKKDPLANFLALVLLASAAGAAAMCYKFLRVSAEYRYLQEQVVRVNQRRALFNTFTLELNEYSIRNRSFMPMLEQMNMRLRQITTTNTPSTRP